MAPCMGVEPIGSCVTGRPRHRLRRTAYRCGAALVQLVGVTLFVGYPPRENRNYTAMGSRKFQRPLAVVTMAPPTILIAAAFLIAVARSCICPYTLLGHVSVVNHTSSSRKRTSVELPAPVV